MTLPASNIRRPVKSSAQWPSRVTNTPRAAPGWGKLTVCLTAGVLRPPYRQKRMHTPPSRSTYTPPAGSELIENEQVPAGTVAKRMPVMV